MFETDDDYKKEGAEKRTKKMIEREDSAYCGGLFLGVISVIIIELTIYGTACLIMNMRGMY